MNSASEPLSVRMALAWVAIYTRGLRAEQREARGAEISSDLWEHRHDAAGGDARGLVARIVAGVPADVLWRFEEGARARRRDGRTRRWSGTPALWAKVIPGLAILTLAVTLIDAPSEIPVMLVGLTVLSVVGLTRGLGVRSAEPRSGTGAHMESRTENRRRATLLVVLAISVIVLGGTYAYAMSLDHWGNTRALIFVGLGWGSLIVGATALILLIIDFARARRA